MDVRYKPGKELTEADALSRLGLEVHLTNAVDNIRLWEGTEHLRQKGHRFEVPETLRPRIFHLYHDSAPSGGHDGVCRTYHKINKRFTWPRMKQDVKEYVRSSDRCQLYKFKYCQRTDEIFLPDHWDKPFKVVHMDFAELKKKAEGVRKTQSFLLAVDQCTRMVATRPGGEDSNSVITLMERQMFIIAKTKVIVCDNGPAFISKRLSSWANEGAFA
ncbi:uncharacterized protein LOC135384601 [Ornithodoros turicata]|uniref:uncharacterized protein LOC135384601 n=1 Tax=Ornithodoros turicata TaxID=34597 RepID=UPI0031398BF2